MSKNKQTAIIKTADNVDVFCSYSTIEDIGKLQPNPRNPNTHPSEQISVLAKIIKYQGWRCPITVSNRSGFIVRGHGRLLAAQHMSLTQVPVDYQDYANEADELADMIADNKIAEKAVTDDEVLKGLLNELDELDVDMDFTGIDFDEVELLLNKSNQDKFKNIIVEKKPPKMVWCLIGIELVKYGTISSVLEELSKNDDIIMENTVSDE